MKTRLGLSAGATLAILLFIAFFDNFTMIPMVSTYAVGLGSGAVMAGWIVAVFSVANMLGNVGAGWILDRWGRRLPLVIALVWAGIGVWLYGLAGSPLELMAARAFHGLGGAVVVPAIFTMAADTAAPERRSAVMGRLGAMIGIAAIIGPMYSGIARQLWGPHAVFNTVLGAMLVGAALAYSLPETLASERVGEAAGGSGAAPSAGLAATPFQVASAAAFVTAFYQGAVTYLLPLHMERLGFPEALSGSVFSLFAIAAVIAMMLVYRFKGRSLIPAGFLFSALGFAVLLWGASPGLIGLGMAVYGIGFGLVYPTLNAQVAALYGTGERGRAYGFLNAFYSFGVVVGPPTMGWLSGFTAPTVLFGGMSIAAGIAALLLFHFRHVAQMPRRDDVPSAAL